MSSASQHALNIQALMDQGFRLDNALSLMDFGKLSATQGQVVLEHLVKNHLRAHPTVDGAHAIVNALQAADVPKISHVCMEGIKFNLFVGTKDPQISAVLLAPLVGALASKPANMFSVDSIPALRDLARHKTNVDHLIQAIAHCNNLVTNAAHYLAPLVLVAAMNDSSGTALTKLHQSGLFSGLSMAQSNELFKQQMSRLSLEHNNPDHCHAPITSVWFNHLPAGWQRALSLQILGRFQMFSSAPPLVALAAQQVEWDALVDYLQDPELPLHTTTSMQLFNLLTSVTALRSQLFDDASPDQLMELHQRLTTLSTRRPSPRLQDVLLEMQQQLHTRLVDALSTGTPASKTRKM